MDPFLSPKKAERPGEVGNAMPVRRRTVVARRLRRDSTDVERMLWQAIREKAAPWKFRRQHPIGGYIADFACPAAKLVIEIDGGQHSVHVAADQACTAALTGCGYRVVRFWNNEVTTNLDGVLETILRALAAPTSPNLSAPKGGEEPG